MSKSNIEAQKEKVRETNELMDHIINLLESKDERYHFEFGFAGEVAKLVIFDKKKETSYKLQIEPVGYDEEGIIKNL